MSEVVAVGATVVLLLVFVGIITLAVWWAEHDDWTRYDDWDDNKEDDG